MTEAPNFIRALATIIPDSYHLLVKTDEKFFSVNEMKEWGKSTIAKIFILRPLIILMKFGYFIHADALVGTVDEMVIAIPFDGKVFSLSQRGIAVAEERILYSEFFIVNELLEMQRDEAFLPFVKHFREIEKAVFSVSDINQFRVVTGIPDWNLSSFQFNYLDKVSQIDGDYFQLNKRAMQVIHVAELIFGATFGEIRP